MRTLAERWARQDAREALYYGGRMPLDARMVAAWNVALYATRDDFEQVFQALQYLEAK